MFTTSSALVQLWARYIKEGKYTREQVPNLSNLRECVYQVAEQWVKHMLS